MDNEATFDKFSACAVEVLQGAGRKGHPSTRASASDLDADSLDLVELVMALEEAFTSPSTRASSKASRPSARLTSS